MNYILLFFSVFVGAVSVLFMKPSKSFVRLLLAFSGAYLLSVTVLHILPEIYAETNHVAHGHKGVSVKFLGILILAGILIQSVLESFSKGLEHGHVHLSDKDKSNFPWMLFVSLCIHALSEGLPIHSSGENLLWAIIVHKIPIAIVLTTLLIHSNLAKVKVFIALAFFALMSPLGYLAGKYLEFLMHHHAEISAFIVGVFIHISTVILFESNENHRFNAQKFSVIFLGLLLGILTL